MKKTLLGKWNFVGFGGGIKEDKKSECSFMDMTENITLKCWFYQVQVNLNDDILAKRMIYRHIKGS